MHKHMHTYTHPYNIYPHNIHTHTCTYLHIYMDTKPLRKPVVRGCCNNHWNRAVVQARFQAD